MQNVVGLITARGGSKGVPNKHLREVGGVPLVQWTVEAATGARHLDRVIVSTDCEDIARVCRDAGAEIPFMRPDELARDDSTHDSVVLHALSWLEAQEGDVPEYVCILQPTSPLRWASDIDAAIELADARDADAVLAVCAASSHPHLVKHMARDGRLSLYMKSESSRSRRQELPQLFESNGSVYVLKSKRVMAAGSLHLENTYGYVMPEERSLDVDTLWDFYLADRVLSDRDMNGYPDIRSAVWA